MKKFWGALFTLVLVSCIMQPIKTDAASPENRAFFITSAVAILISSFYNFIQHILIN